LAVGLNEVQLDEARLEAEAHAATDGVPDDSAPAPGEAQGPALAGDLTMEQIEQAAAQYDFGALMLVSRAFDALAPAWGVTDDEKQRLAHALAMTAAAWFPDAAIPPKYVVLFILGGSVYSIAESRRDPATGKFRARHVKNVRTVQEVGAGGASENAGEGASGAGFSTAT